MNKLPGLTNMVDVGGYALFLEIAGTGSPTVVLDAGLGSAHTTWEPIWPALCATTRCCRYDRAGIGRSDPGPLPRTSQQIVTELHRLVHAAAIPGPYLLVGQSFGCHAMRLFAHRYPAEVAGLVLIDPATEDAPQTIQALVAPEVWAALVADEQAYLQGPDVHPEEVTLDQSGDQVRAASDFGDLPLLLLSAGKLDLPPDMPYDAQALLWDLHARIAQSSTRARHERLDGGHLLHHDQPAAVVAAIVEFIELLRHGAAWPDSAAPASIKPR